jgi:hypothetical protein
MKATIRFCSVLLFLALAPGGFAKDPLNRDFWQRIEIGTNLIPLVDSTTLKFDNLMVKYYYGKDMDKAIRINLIKSNIDFNKVNVPYQFAKHHFELGHLWYYSLNEKVRLYQSFDIEYCNGTNSSYFDVIKNSIKNHNDVFGSYSIGIKYNIYKNLNIELETRARLGARIIYQSYNYDYVDGQKVHIYNPTLDCFYYFYYFPLKCFTINYKF